MTQYDVYAMPDGNGTLLEFFQYVNNTSTGYFFSGFVFLLWIIIVIAGSRASSPSRAVTFASFLCGVLSVMLSVLDLLAPKIMYLFLIGIAIGAIWLKLEE